MFNAFKLRAVLEEAGFSRQQAEIQLQVINEIIEDDLATKHDLQILETNLRNDMKQLEYRMTIKLGTFLIIAVSTTLTVMRFWLSH